MKYMDVQISRSKEAHDTYMEVGGTTPWMGEIELRLEQQSRAMPGRLYGNRRLITSGTSNPAIAER